MSFDLSKLGVRRNVPRVNFTEYSGVLSAPPKFGKTTMASMYPNAVLLGFEKGYKAQDVNVRDINVWEDFIDFVDLLEEHIEAIGDSIQTIVIDTVDVAYPMVIPYMCKIEGRRDGTIYHEKEDMPYGRGWALHDAYFRRQTSRIYNLGLSILYITHSKIKTIRPKHAEDYDIFASSMPQRLEDMIFPECDYILYGERVKISGEGDDAVVKRKITTRGTDELEAGSRVYMDEDIIFDTEEEAMDEFQKAFRASIIENIKRSNGGEDIDVEALSEQQNKERREQVASHINRLESIDVEENKKIIKHIKDNLQKMDAGEMRVIMVEYGIEDFSKPEKIETEALEKIAALIK